MVKDDFITAEERYSPTLTKVKVKKFLAKHHSKIETSIYGVMLFGAIFGGLILISNIN